MIWEMVGSVLVYGRLVWQYVRCIYYISPLASFASQKRPTHGTLALSGLLKQTIQNMLFGVFSDLDNDLFLCNGLDFGVETILWCIVE